MTSASAKDLARQLTTIADASRRGDGSDIPLGEITRRAAALLTRYAEVEGELETEENLVNLEETLGALEGLHGEGWINITMKERRLFARLLRDRISRIDRLTAQVAALRAERDAANARADRLAVALRDAMAWVEECNRAWNPTGWRRDQSERAQAIDAALLTEPEAKGGDPAPVPATTEKTDD